jgi:hypothetical protein
VQQAVPTGTIGDGALGQVQAPARADRFAIVPELITFLDPRNSNPDEFNEKLEFLELLFSNMIMSCKSVDERASYPELERLLATIREIATIKGIVPPKKTSTLPNSNTTQLRALLHAKLKRNLGPDNTKLWTEIFKIFKTNLQLHDSHGAPVRDPAFVICTLILTIYRSTGLNGLGRPHDPSAPKYSKITSDQAKTINAILARLNESLAQPRMLVRRLDDRVSKSLLFSIGITEEILTAHDLLLRVCHNLSKATSNITVAPKNAGNQDLGGHNPVYHGEFGSRVQLLAEELTILTNLGAIEITHKKDSLKRESPKKFAELEEEHAKNSLALLEHFSIRLADALTKEQEEMVKHHKSVGYNPPAETPLMRLAIPFNGLLISFRNHKRSKKPMGLSLWTRVSKGGGRDWMKAFREDVSKLNIYNSPKTNGKGLLPLINFVGSDRYKDLLAMASRKQPKAKSKEQEMKERNAEDAFFLIQRQRAAQTEIGEIEKRYITETIQRTDGDPESPEVVDLIARAFNKEKEYITETLTNIIYLEGTLFADKEQVCENCLDQIKPKIIHCLHLNIQNHKAKKRLTPEMLAKKLREQLGINSYKSYRKKKSRDKLRPNLFEEGRETNNYKMYIAKSIDDALDYAAADEAGAHGGGGDTATAAAAHPSATAHDTAADEAGAHGGGGAGASAAESGADESKGDGGDAAAAPFATAPFATAATTHGRGGAGASADIGGADGGGAGA